MTTSCEQLPIPIHFLRKPKFYTITGYPVTLTLLRCTAEHSAFQAVKCCIYDFVLSVRPEMPLATAWAYPHEISDPETLLERPS